MSVFVCGCCQEPFPTLHRHVHHKVPRATGGPDIASNLIDLCPGCHDTLHNIAHKMLNKKFSASSIRDTLYLIYKENTKAIETCMWLAIQVRDATIKSREMGVSPDQLVQIGTTLRKRHKDILALRCQELGVSQENYLRGLVLSDLSKRFGDAHIQVAEELRLIRELKKSRSRGGS